MWVNENGVKGKKLECTLHWLFLTNRMIDLARKLDKADREALSRAAMHLTKMEQYSFAAEVYSKMGDIKALINLHVEAKHWEDVSQRLS